MADCCPIAPYHPTPWDPRRQTEPVRVWHAYDAKTGGAIASFTFRARAQGSDAIARRMMVDRGVNLPHGLDRIG